MIALVPVAGLEPRQPDPGVLKMSTSPKRFKIALSFSGDQRPFVKEIAEYLSQALGRERILYDFYYEAEFARVDLDTYLQNLYHQESELIAIFLSEGYEEREWCGLEWRAIRDLIKKREIESVMPLRFDMTEIPGLFSNAGYIWIDERTPQEIAEKILERYRLVVARGTCVPFTTVSSSPPNPPTTPRTAPTRLRHNAAQLFGREDELQMLDDAWAEPATHIAVACFFDEPWRHVSLALTEPD